MDWDVIVIGAGAAGLVAAARAAERGKCVLLLEKGKKPGVKILMSGGTRCNITHACDTRGIVDAFGPNGKFLHSALAAFGPDDVVALFEAEGVPTKVEETGKIFPVSNRAVDVLDALLRRLRRSGAELALAEPATAITANSNGFTVTTLQRTLTCEKVVLTTGGQSYPGSGTTGDGYAFAAVFGHTIVPPRPALVPLKVNAPWVSSLRGVTLPKIGLRVLDGETVLASRTGSLLFAHFGLTGPALLDVSRAVSGHPNPKTLVLEIDFLPGETEHVVDEFLRVESAASGKQLLAGVLSRKLTRSLCDQLLVLCDLPADRTAAALSKVDRQKLAAAVKRPRVPLAGTLGFEKAEVTSGGVSLDEVDSRTMESKKHPGLYLAGEVLDLDGRIGGYNFQAAWSTGWLAGESV
jgi:predicted Rossmann fold flavoprotein